MASAEIKTDIEGKLTLFCDSCDEDGQTNTARSFCFDCERYFCSDCEKLHAKFSRNHKTTAGDELPEAEDLDPLKQCASHVKHSVEFYCEEHQLVFCRLCRHIKHGDCEVKDFGMACREFDLETEFNGAVENLHKVTGQMNEAKNRELRQLERLEEEAEQRKSFITNFRRELEELFDRYENAGDEYDRANTERANAVLGSVDVYLKQTEKQMCLLKETKGHPEECVIFASLIKSNQICKEHTSKVKNIASDATEHKPFTFHDANASTLLEKFFVLIRSEQSEPTGSDEAGLREATSDLRKKSFWNIKACTLIKDSVVTSNRRPVNITACCTLANGKIILYDSTYKKLMLMNENLKFLSDINVHHGLFDIAAMDENTVAVSIPDERTVQFIASNPGLKLEKQVAFGRQCYGLALLEEELYICTKYDTVNLVNRARKSFQHKDIQIWSPVSQQLLKSVEIVTDAEPLYISPGSDGTDMFLSGGHGKEPVMCISNEGHVIYKYFDDTIMSPGKIFSDAEDNLLVHYSGSWPDNSSGVRIIKSGGECGKDLLLQEENLGKITALHFDKRTDILLVASEDDVEEETVSKLRMFKLEY